MPPKVKVTQNDVVNAALEIVRESGAQSINARSVAAVLSCSTQPIFSNFQSIDELKIAVIQKADELYQEYVKREIEKNEYPPYKASGMGYIRFAKEEKELFKLLFMRDRTNEGTDTSDHLFSEMVNLVHENTGLTNDAAALFHVEIWIVVHGIATMLATNYLDLDWTLIAKILSDHYVGLKNQFTDKE